MSDLGRRMGRRTGRRSARHAGPLTGPWRRTIGPIHPDDPELRDV